MFTGRVEDVGTVEAVDRKGRVAAGNPVNLEVDVLAKYVEKLVRTG